MALGRVWYGAKYSQRVWERFAHLFESFGKSENANFFRALFEVSMVPMPGRPTFGNLTFETSF